MRDILNDFMEPDDGGNGGNEVTVLMKEQRDQTNILIIYLQKLRPSCT